jgi:hypothetical protein
MNTYSDNQQQLDEIIYNAIEDGIFGADITGTAYGSPEEYGYSYHISKPDVEFNGFDSFPITENIPDGFYKLHPQTMTSTNKIETYDGHEAEFEFDLVITGADVYTDKFGQKMVLPIGALQDVK